MLVLIGDAKNEIMGPSGPPLIHLSVKVRSYYATKLIALRCRYLDYISATSHRSITAFQVKINLTSCDTAQYGNIAWVCSAATQGNCGEVWMDFNFDGVYSKMEHSMGSLSGVYIFQKVWISSPPISPRHWISSPCHAHVFIVPSLISSPISNLAEFFPYPKSREFARICTPDHCTTLKMFWCQLWYNCPVSDQL